MIPVAEALARILSLAGPLGTETVPLSQASGRVLAADAVARRAQPPFAASAMDGYALADPPAPGQVYRVIGTAQAGAAYGGSVGPGQAVRIFTGAPVPQGATNVVIQEDVTRDGARIIIAETLGDGPNIRPAGADFAAGHRLAAPRRLRPADLALLAAMNCSDLTVTRRPEVAFIATGDELVMPGEVPGPDQIVASNIFALKAMAEAEGARARILPIARDSEAALAQMLDMARGADVIVTIGGASVGDHDLVAKVAAASGMQRAFHKIAMRPGKPLMSGRLGDAVMLGLPGNPVSAIVCGHLFLLPLLRALQGLPDPAPRPLQARLACDVPANGQRAHYMRASLAQGDGLPLIDPFPDQDSGRLTPLAEASALLIRPVGDPARLAGTPVDYFPL
ncbi:molybdopterin molybdotransferase MoeA [Gemmobacter nectariphilus]|uniref:molybdopterin molybdotransferase MoeA n=1 Tax=Gemmobacter nectariphilus TaxID=220343 RepID=UPI0004044D19|nr:molybdopterin molybdotransferase MoeA [Gemmobacter nectariphilus]